MVDCLWLETVSCVTLSLTRKDDAIANDFWCNTAKQVASHTKIDFGLKLLSTTALRESVSYSKLAAQLRLNAFWCITEKHVNIKSTILMAVTMISWSVVLLTAQIYCWFRIYSIEIFASVFTRKHCEQMVACIPTKTWELYYKSFWNLSIKWKETLHLLA